MRMYLLATACGAVLSLLTANASAVACPVGCEHFQSQHDYYCEVNVSPESENYTYEWQVNRRWYINGSPNESAIVAECMYGAGSCPFGYQVTVRDSQLPAGNDVVCTRTMGSLTF